jgi:hypothetical protein
MQDISHLSPVKRALLETYLQRGSVERLAQELRQRATPGAGDSRSAPVALHTGGSRPPLFFLHGDYRDHPLWCLNMARDLGPDQPFYALEPERVDGRIVPSLEHHAAAHLRLVRAVQPEGPYMLGGWCGGALLAFEMARQLRAEGQQVDMLVLMEPPMIPAVVKFARGLISHLGVLGLGEDKQVDWFLQVLPLSDALNRCLRYPYRLLRNKHVRHKLKATLSDVAAQTRPDLPVGILTPASSPSVCVPGLGHTVLRSARPREAYLDIFTWMAAVYPLRPYPGQITFFWSSDEFLNKPGAITRWCQVPEAAELHVIAGTVMTCRTEHVHELASHLRACLSMAQAGVLSERS